MPFVLTPGDLIGRFGFGCTGYLGFGTGLPGNIGGRLVVVIDAPQDRVDIRSIDAFAVTDNNPLDVGTNASGPFSLNSEVDVLKTSINASIPASFPQSGNRQFTISSATVTGAVWMWSNCASCNPMIQQFNPPASGLPLGCAQGIPNSWRFPRGVLSISVGERFIIVMGVPIGLGSYPGSGYTPAFGSYRCLSVLGRDYGIKSAFSGGETVTKSLPRFD
jgi:hypothetical protein